MQHMMTEGQTLAEEEDDIAVDAGLAPTPAKLDPAVYERVKIFCQKRAVVVRSWAADRVVCVTVTVTVAVTAAACHYGITLLAP